MQAKTNCGYTFHSEVYLERLLQRILCIPPTVYPASGESSHRCNLSLKDGKPYSSLNAMSIQHLE